MVETFKLMNQLRLKRLQNVSDYEILSDKELTKEMMLAEMFCKHFKMWVSVIAKPKFSYIDKSDKVSYVLQGIYNAIQNFDITQPVKFITYAYRCVYNNLTTVVMRSNARGGWQSKDNISLDMLSELTEGNPYEGNFNIIRSQDFSSIDFVTSLDSLGFTDREKKICILLMEDPNMSDVEMSKLLNIHRHTIRKDKLKIKNKLGSLYSFC